MADILTIDVGNTRMKCTLFRDGEPERVVAGAACADGVETMLSLCSVEGIALCSVGDIDSGVAECVAASGLPYVCLNPSTRMPFEVDYDRNGIGADRLAAAAGVDLAQGNALIADAGTALTLDLLADNRFVGGNISPGISLRFRALHQCTSLLPDVHPAGPTPDFGYDTETAIRAGVMNGIIAEIADTFHRACVKFENMRLILTGGDALLLEQPLRNAGIPMASDPFLVGRGLVKIFKHNINL